MKNRRKLILYTIVPGIMLISSCARIVPYESPLYSINKNSYKSDYMYSDSFVYGSPYLKHYGTTYYLFDDDLAFYYKYNNLNKQNPQIGYYDPKYY
jgi:hypothetical protein